MSWTLHRVVDGNSAGTLNSVRDRWWVSMSVAKGPGHDLQTTNCKWRLGDKQRMSQNRQWSCCGERAGLDFALRKASRKHRYSGNRIDEPIDEQLWMRSPGNRIAGGASRSERASEADGSLVKRGRAPKTTQCGKIIQLSPCSATEMYPGRGFTFVVHRTC
jgi:hypothetical protein